MSRMSTEEMRNVAERAGADLDGADAHEIIRWAHDTFGTGFVVTASMADGVLTHVASAAVPGIRVFFLDTGYHFAETIGTRDAVAASYDAQVETVGHPLTVAEHESSYGRLHETYPDLCCAMRKVFPLDRALRPYDAWASGARRAEATSRSVTPVVGWDARRRKVKVNPLAAWSDEDVETYIADHGILVNPLREVGYASIGCAPCTRPVAPGEDARAGRWSGRGKTECGIH
jgi:phosphoadenosine phosphosulfate reductase